MSPSRLKLLGHTVEDEAENDPTLADELQEIIAQHRQELVKKIREWLIYSVKQGVRKLYLDECQFMSRSDETFIIAWLREQGITIREPRWGFFGSGGRTSIEIP